MKTLVFLFFIIPVISLGQEVRWNFEDNDLTQWYQNVPGRWEVSDEYPITGKYSLHHAFDNDKADVDWIALFHDPLKLAESQAIWQFSIRYKYKPSAKNNWAVMFAGSNLPGNDKLMDYALVLGVNYRGSDDEIRLWKQKGENIESILSTHVNWENDIKTNNPVSFRITRTINGLISVEIDTSGGNFFKIGETIETEIIHSQFFLVYYKYTSTYDRGLYFDDLYIEGNFSKDTLQPRVKTIHTISSKSILVEFNKIVSTKEGNGFCIGGIGCRSPQNTIGSYLLVDLPFEL